jgi:glycosyltransferase involved in cell wall biosynthesis
MEKKPTIIYVIDSLGRGGAEVLLVGILADIARQYQVVLVSLTDLVEMEELIPAEVSYHSLGVGSKFHYPRAVQRLRMLIRQYKPNIIHAHLLNSSIVTRLAAGNKVPVIISLHSILSKTAFNESFLYRLVEKKLFNKKDKVIAVSTSVLEDYINAIDKPDQSVVLPNYVEPGFNFNNTWQPAPGHLKLVAVGNIKPVKNYQYLLRAFRSMDSEKFSLDIYGKIDPLLGEAMQQEIKQFKLPIRLMGPSSAINKILPHYDAFVMPSLHEGFGIAAIEAMASGLPLLLSDIAVLRDISFNNALFFSLDDPASFIRQAEKLANREIDVEALRVAGKNIVETRYGKSQYIARLLEIYAAAINDI